METYPDIDYCVITEKTSSLVLLDSLCYKSR